MHGQGDVRAIGMAGTAIGTDPVGIKSRGFQVSLGGLIVLVLAAGVAAGVVRSAREVWGVRPIVNTSGLSWAPVGGNGWPPLTRTAGVVLEIAAVFLLVILARTLIGLFGGARPAERQAQRTRLWGIAWRTGSICFLLWFISEESSVLRIDLAREAAIASAVPGWDYNYIVRQQLLPTCGVFAILGLILGMGVSFLFPAAPRGGKRPYWLFVMLAAVAGVLIAALPMWASLIPYLVLVALEAVTNAMHHRLNPGSAFSTRLLRAGIDVVVSCCMCTALALAVARDFEMLRRGKASATTRAGWGLRLFLLAGAAVAGTYIAFVTIPAIHPWFAEGFRQVLNPAGAGMIVCGFGLFGAGMAARAIAGVPERQPSRRVSWLSALYRLAILGAIVFAVLNVLPDSSVVEPYAPSFVTSAVALIKGSVTLFWEAFPDWCTPSELGMFAIENLLWISLILAIVCFVVEVLIRDNVGVTSPFDRLAESRQGAWRFTWLVLGFVVVCLAALPTLIVAGQVVLHLRMYGGDLMTRGWGR
jgi:hypothetical protein